jgi:hypothetical protein
VVYLISPEGTRYQVAEFDPMYYFAITAWTAGETVATISFCDEPHDCDWKPTASLDLETGTELWDEDSFGGAVQYISTLPDGTRIWAEQGIGGGYLETGGQGNRRWTEIDRRWSAFYPVIASPDGNYLALGTSDEWLRSPSLAGGINGSEVLIRSLTTGEETLTPSLDGDWSCTPRDWLEPTRLAIACGSVTEMSGWVPYIYNLLTGELTPGAEGHYNDDYWPRYSEPYEPYVRRDVQLDYGQYAGLYYDGLPDQDVPQDSPESFWIDDHGTLTPVTLRNPEGKAFSYTEIDSHVGPLIYVLASSSNYYRTDETLIVYNMDTGSQSILFGPPLAGPTVGWDPEVDESAWALAVLNWAVAH